MSCAPLRHSPPKVLSLRSYKALLPGNVGQVQKALHDAKPGTDANIRNACIERLTRRAGSLTANATSRRPTFVAGNSP